jgi:hypothetical protein
MKYIYLFCLFLFANNILLSQVDFQSSDLPIVVINTEQAIIDEPKQSAFMGIIYNGVGQRNNITDPFNHYNGKIGIELRGQSSQFFYDKKSYGVETRDATGENLNVSLLGMPEENDWILNGPFGDKTMMRNILAYQLTNEIGQYAARTRFCEVVLDSQYIGVYILMENIKRDKNRVDIAKLEPEEESGDDLTGGYIFRIDKYSPFYDINRWISTAGTNFNEIEYQVVYPKQQILTETQFTYIKDFVEDFENTLKSPDYADPENGYRSILDVESFVDYLLINELTRNPDGYRISTYLHKQNIRDGGKLRMGPVWDFNLGMGNTDFCLGEGYQTWVLNYKLVCEYDQWQIPFWWDRLLTDVYFIDLVQERWKALRQSTFSVPHIHGMIDSLATVVNEAQARNYQQWDILDEYIWPNPYIGGNYPNEVQRLKTWFSDRIQWIDENMDDIAGQVQGNFSFANIRVYPNPVQNELFIDLQMESPTNDFKLTIYNMLGQKVSDVKLEPVIGVSSKLPIPKSVISKLAQGIYIYNLTINGNIAQSGKLMKQ